MLKTDTIQITPDLLALLSEIDEFKGAWRALGTLAPERLSALQRVATIESIGSSTRIEGSKLTDREVEAPAVQSRYPEVRAPRRIGGGGLHRTDGLGVPGMGRPPVQREPPEAVPPDLEAT